MLLYWGRIQRTKASLKIIHNVLNSCFNLSVWYIRLIYERRISNTYIHTLFQIGKTTHFLAHAAYKIARVKRNDINLNATWQRIHTHKIRCAFWSTEQIQPRSLPLKIWVFETDRKCMRLGVKDLEPFRFKSYFNFHLTNNQG